MATLITVQGVADYTGWPLPAAGSGDERHWRLCVDAINAGMPRIAPALKTVPPPKDWPDDVRAAALLQAGRLISRRNSLTGVVGYTEAGGAYVSKWDPDVERMLAIGSWVVPRCG